MADPAAFAKLVPGFDFLQGLVKNAGSTLPGMNQWIAPTLDPEEIEKRIRDLRTVQFWLEQNAKMIGATVQALEVQRMTLSTLKSMNLPIDAVRETLQIRPAEEPAPAPAPKAAPRPARAPTPAPAADASPAVDPMQWWGALTQQFSELAAKTLQDLPAAAAPAAPAPVPAKKGAARPRRKVG